MGVSVFQVGANQLGALIYKYALQLQMPGCPGAPHAVYITYVLHVTCLMSRVMSPGFLLSSLCGIGGITVIFDIHLSVRGREDSLKNGNNFRVLSCGVFLRRFNMLFFSSIFSLFSHSNINGVTDGWRFVPLFS